MGDTSPTLVKPVTHGTYSRDKCIASIPSCEVWTNVFNVQVHQLERIRAAAFQALGTLSRFATGVHLQTFMEQVVNSCNPSNHSLLKTRSQHKSCHIR